jgi:hypothetical protein
MESVFNYIYAMMTKNKITILRNINNKIHRKIFKKNATFS